jgi:hypothetical protein
MIDCYIFDIDGTVADISHRLHFIQKTPKDWDAFHNACCDDKPIPHMVRLAQVLNARIVYVTGRPLLSEKDTLYWIWIHIDVAGPLYMRKNGDHRRDDIVKREMLDRIRADGYNPIMAFEDRSRVVKMWREAGIPCAQVAEGDF